MQYYGRPWFTILLIGFWLVPGTAFGQSEVQLTQVWELADSLDRPESALYDPDRGVVYVSNIVGDASEKDGEGYIAKVSPEGAFIQARWVSGLNAPKGMALSGDTLYIADIDALVAVDAETGTILERYPAEGARFLNDVTADEAGRVYVSDSRGNAVYCFSAGRLSRWLEDLPSPNGLYAADDRLIAAAGAAGAENPGGSRYLQTISLEDQEEIKPLGEGTPIGGLDAVVPDGQGGYFLSDWGAGEVLHFRDERGAVPLKELGQGTADLDYAASEGLLFVPVMMSDRLVAFRVEGL